MKPLLPVVLSILLWAYGVPVAAQKQLTTSSPNALQCAAFSPYTGTLTPHYGAAPSKKLITTLIDRLIQQTPYRCIMTYGVLNGLDAIFSIAEARKIKVIAVIWLDNDPAINTLSIAKGIEVAKTFPKTIIKLSCGVELRTRYGNAFDGEITRCIEDLRKAKVSQPITTIDTWWEWCNHSFACTTSSFADQVDWLGINVYPWWENKFSDTMPCTPADKAADFHIARLTDLHRAYPDKEIILTEFGWPSGPEGSSETNIKTGQHCGIASPKNQALVVQETFKKLAKKHWSGIVFEAFAENWKTSKENDFGKFWGICSGQPPYTCSKDLIKH